MTDAKERSPTERASDHATDHPPLGVSGRIARAFLDSKLTPLLVVASLLLGAFAVMVTPREEEPQISVPMIDVFAGFPGATAEEVERRVISPLERTLYEIENVEYIYSTSQPSGGMIIVRFLVGSDADEAVLRVQAKVAEVAPTLPAGAVPPMIVPRSIDDVPVLAYTLWSEDPATTPLQLRTAAQELRTELARHPRVARVQVIGGGQRVVQITLDRTRLAAHYVSALQVHQALAGLNWRLPAGSFARANVETTVEVGSFFRSAEDVGRAVVAVYQGRPVYLADVAEITDGPEEPSEYVWILAGAAGGEKELPSHLDRPALTVAVAKKPGTNAVDLVTELDRRLDAFLQGPVVPDNVRVTKTRDYGFTADEKSSELIKHLWIATLAVVALMALALGRREAVVVLVAVPTTLALTLASSYLFGYTLNRVTLFALIFAIGILVDDAIVVVENIHRHYKLGWTHPRFATAYATDEVGNPTILATFTVVAALLPLAFVSGLMGPYMRPIPINASAAMVFSLLVAFVVSPWLTYRLFKRQAEKIASEHGHVEHGLGDVTVGATPDEPTPDPAAGEVREDSRMQRFYGRMFRPLLAHRWRRWALLGGVAVLLLASMSLVYLKVVTVKMLPYDNKSEVQVVIDTPEGTTLEQTAALARALAERTRHLPEVTDVQVYAGTSAPFNFNGLVRHYFLREGPVVADLQVNLLAKHHRDRESHPFAKTLRELLAPVVREVGGSEVSVKVTEVPPGPPVLATLVAEVYGPDLGHRIRLAQEVREIFERTPGVVDVDWWVEAPGPKLEIEIDRTKARRLGTTPEVVARTLRVALHGAEAGLLHDPDAREPIPLVLRLDRAQRSDVESLLDLRLHNLDPTVQAQAMAAAMGMGINGGLDAAGGGSGPPMVPLSELVKVRETRREAYIYHKNLQPVSYVVAEVAGSEESPVYAILAMQAAISELRGPGGEPLVTLSSTLPDDTTGYAMKWDGEWQITYEVFRDMGLAFAVVMVLIYVLVVGWFKSFVTPLIIMAPIPLTLIGILPAHGFGGVFFTATSMIGFIALAGIIVRNSILLVDFINLELRRGACLEDAVVQAASVRFRPIALTAAALVVGGSVILLDPIFQGLAVALISGVVVSTALTLVVIPLLYYMYLKTLPTEKVMGICNA